MFRTKRSRIRARIRGAMLAQQFIHDLKWEAGYLGGMR